MLSELLAGTGTEKGMGPRLQRELLQMVRSSRAAATRTRHRRVTATRHRHTRPPQVHATREALLERFIAMISP